MSTTSEKLIVSVSGIRGVIGKSLTPEDATRFASALGTLTQGGRMVVSRDSRPSGNMLRHAVIAGLLSVGCSIEDIGIASTPTCGFAIRHLGAAGGIQITASHNPAPWNGLKLFGADGSVLSAEKGKQVQEIFTSNQSHRVKWHQIGRVGAPPEVGEEHIRRVTDSVSVATIASAAFRVFLDGNGGAGGPIATQLLLTLGCEVIEHACYPDGHFVHEAEPIPAHLTEVAPRVQSVQAAVGFVLDPDADRLALIDEKGQCVSEELTLALAIQHRLQEKRGPVVINMSTSRVIEDIAHSFRCELIRSAVGEANVVSQMRRVDAVIGGEGNGGVIDPRIGWVRDPLIGMAMILQLMAETGKPISQLIAELPHYAMLKTKFAVEQDRLPRALAAIEKCYPEAKIDRLDGLRLDWPDRWLHIRPSNTEPVVRIIGESPTESETQALCESAGKILMES